VGIDGKLNFSEEVLRITGRVGIEKSRQGSKSFGCDLSTCEECGGS